MSISKTNDFNVCGVLVKALPAKHSQLQTALESLAGVEIHGRSDDGHLIVTIEDTDQTLASEQLLAVNQVEGVLSASLVYHHCEPLGAEI